MDDNGKPSGLQRKR